MQKFIIIVVIIVFILLLFFSLGPADLGQAINQEGADPGSFGFEESTVALDSSDFMEVSHLILRGPNCKIGRKLAEVALSGHKSGQGVALKILFQQNT